MMKSVLISTSVAFFVCGSATAQGVAYSKYYDVCIQQADRDQRKTIVCDKEEMIKQDIELNKKYKELSKILSPYRNELLISSERAWIRFRDAQCDFQESEIIGGPSGIVARAQQEFRGKCLLEQTQLRATALQDAYVAAKNDGGLK